jgi:hypothetical protein
MLQIVFLVSLESSGGVGVHRLGFMALESSGGGGVHWLGFMEFGLGSAKVLGN